MQYLYRSKNLQIQQRYLPHVTTLYIDKVIEPNLKKIVTFGLDCFYAEDGEVQDKAYVLKVWDFEKLTGETCKCVLSVSLVRPL